MVDTAQCVERLAALAGVSLDAADAYDWAEIEADLGVRLPADYKMLAEGLPGGFFRGWVRLRKPARVVGGGQRLLDKFATGKVETMREWRAAGQGRFPYPIYPEPGGLLPWGIVRDGGNAFWLTGSGHAKKWPVVVASADYEDWDRFDGTVCEFLTAVAAARYDASGFTEGPTHVIAYDSGDQLVTRRRIALASRPVFEADSEAPVRQPHTRNAVMQEAAVTSVDFWVTQVRLAGDRLPVNELGAVRELIGPPPVAVPEVDWAAVHARLGFRLPADYREFIGAYGAGTLGDIRILAPGAPGDWDLFALLEQAYQQIPVVVRIGNGPRVNPVFWGETAGGWSCAWVPASSNPDEWIVAEIKSPDDMLGGGGVRPGRSFSSTLKEQVQDERVHRRDRPPGPVTFTSCRQA